MLQLFPYHCCFADLMDCSAVGIVEVEITCGGYEPPVSFQCSFSGGPLYPCELPTPSAICLILPLFSGVDIMGIRYVMSACVNLTMTWLAELFYYNNIILNWLTNRLRTLILLVSECVYKHHSVHTLACMFYAHIQLSSNHHLGNTV